MRANFKCYVNDDKSESWACEGTVLGWYEDYSSDYQEQKIQADVKLLYFVRERDGRQEFADSLATMPNKFDRHAHHIIEEAAKIAFEECLKPGPFPSDLGMKE